jgi:N-acetylmuramoyl-L-alanine amidase
MAERENAADAVGGVNVARCATRRLLQAMLDMSTTAQIKDSLKLGHEVLGASARSASCTSARWNRPALRCSRRRTSPASWSRRPSSPTPKKKTCCATATTAPAGGRAGHRHPRYFARNPPLARQRQL